MSIARPKPDAASDREKREFDFDLTDFRQIAAILYADSGIFLSEQKTSLVYGRLVKRLRALGLESFKEYCRLVSDKNAVGERQQLLGALTTNVTAFFRERHHFDHLKTVELPPLLRAARNGARVRIWSAGCSKGHEPFSIAMTILSLMPDAGRHDIKILGTDIDPAVVATGRDAVYDSEDLADVSKAELSRFFIAPDGADNGRLVATPELRALVTFRELNLMEPWPMTGLFNILFCRNVTIYFDAPTQATLWSRFASVIEPGGLMCIGHSERLSGDAVKRFTAAGTTMYRHGTGARA